MGLGALFITINKAPWTITSSSERGFVHVFKLDSTLKTLVSQVYNRDRGPQTVFATALGQDGSYYLAGRDIPHAGYGSGWFLHLDTGLVTIANQTPLNSYRGDAAFTAILDRPDRPGSPLVAGTSSDIRFVRNTSLWEGGTRRLVGFDSVGSAVGLAAMRKGYALATATKILTLDSTLIIQHEIDFPGLVQSIHSAGEWILAWGKDLEGRPILVRYQILPGTLATLNQPRIPQRISVRKMYTIDGRRKSDGAPGRKDGIGRRKVFLAQFNRGLGK